MVFPILGAIGSTLFGSAAATAATIGAVGSVAAAVYSGNKQKKAQEAANRANAEAQEAANRANAEAQQKQNQFNLEQADPAEIRRKFEAAGFNPVLGLSNWQAVQQTGFVPNQAAIAAPAFSTGIAEAGAVFGNFFDGIAKERSALTAAQQENQKLKDRLRDQMLRPTVGGIFGGGDRPLSGTTKAILPSGDPRLQPVGPGTAWADDKDGKAASDEAYRPGTAPAMFLGMPWRRSGLFTDGEWIEAAYGDNPLLSWPLGVASFSADLGYNLRGVQNEILAKGRGTGPTMRIGGKDYKLHDSKAMRSTAKNPLRNPAAMHSAIGGSYRGKAN